MHVVCPDAEPGEVEQLHETVGARLVAAGHRFSCHVVEHGDEARLAARLADADGVLLSWGLPSGVLARCPSVRVVSYLGTGVRTYVDMAEAARLGVTVCRVPSYGADTIAEHALALLLALAHGVPAGDGLVRGGGWGQPEVVQLSGKRLGVVGLGGIGARMVELGRGIGMDVVTWTRTRRPEAAGAAPWVPLDELFATSDAVSLHVAHTPQTEGLIGRELLERMPSHGLLVNTARAEIVDGVALAELLERGAIAGAASDVFDREPPRADDPLLASERTVLTPHVAYNSPEASGELLRIAVDNLIAFGAGTPQNVVR